MERKEIKSNASGPWRCFEVPAQTVKNSQGVELEIDKHHIFVTGAVLKRIGKESDMLKNSNGVPFIINNVEVRLPEGPVPFDVMCYEGNYNVAKRNDDINTDPLKVGESYLTTMRIDENGTPQLSMSHLPAGNRINGNDVRDVLASFGLESLIGIAEVPTASTATADEERAEAATAGAPA